MGEALRALRGGLGYSVVIVGALSRPHGHRGRDGRDHGPAVAARDDARGLRPKLAAGTICAAGTLGQIIPPSTVLIFVGDILQGAKPAGAARARQLGPSRSRWASCSPGAMLPGLVLVACTCCGFSRVHLRPAGPATLEMSAEQRAGLPGRVLGAPRAAAAADFPGGAGLDPRRHRDAPPNRRRVAPWAPCSSRE